jgi:hypothetical protein
MTRKERNPVAYFVVANIDNREITIYERQYYRSGIEFKMSTKMHKIKTIDFPVRYADDVEERMYFFEAASSLARMYGAGTMIERIIGNRHEVLILDEEIHWREMHW